MSIEINSELPPEEKNGIFRQAAKEAHKDAARMVYKEAIERGASTEEAAKEASEVKVSL